jgi:hypothetical protein
MHRPIIVNKTIGATQEGFLAISSNVLFGEKRTPMIRPNGLREPCDSGAGTGVVAIKDSSITRLRSTALKDSTRGHREIFQWEDSNAEEERLTVDSLQFTVRSPKAQGSRRKRGEE